MGNDRGAPYPHLREIRVTGANAITPYGGPPRQAPGRSRGVRVRAVVLRAAARLAVIVGALLLLYVGVGSIRAIVGR